MKPTDLNLNQKLIEIQTRFKSKKSRFNSFGKYYFRAAEDILEAVKPFLKELGVTVTINEELISDSNQPIIKTVASLNDGDFSITAQAIVGVDLNQKGMQVPQQYGAASSYGKKYALGNLFLIDDTQDSDATNNHGKSSDDKLEMTDTAFEKAKKYISSGGSMDSIRAKYKLTSGQELALKKLNG